MTSGALYRLDTTCGVSALLTRDLGSLLSANSRPIIFRCSQHSSSGVGIIFLLSGRHYLASPKSQILISQFSSTSTLSGLMSRCSSPAVCRNFRLQSML